MRWYAEQCDGDWEHRYGIEIGTLDNPGWSLKIDLVGTSLAGRELERERFERTEHDWVHVWSDGLAFQAACGPVNLVEAIQEFERFAGA